MPTDIATGQNRAGLVQIGSDWDTAKNAQTPGRRPRKGKVGNNGKIAFNGTGAQTAFNIPHGIVNDAGNGVVPTYFNAEGIDAVSNAAKVVTATTTNIVVTYTAAPASGTNNVNLVWTAER